MAVYHIQDLGKDIAAGSSWPPRQVPGYESFYDRVDRVPMHLMTLATWDTLLQACNHTTTCAIRRFTRW